MKPRIAIHKFSSCDGCQLAFLNLGEDLLTLAAMVDIVHFVEAGPVNPEQRVNIAFVEGSISTPDDLQRIASIRAHSDYLVTLGACATSGGIQALRNIHDTDRWVASIYATPEHISTLDRVSPIAEHVKVDLELWGCPVSSQQVVAAVRNLLWGVTPKDSAEKVCLACKRAQTVCTLVAHGTPCLGPVTRGGCGALCPQFGRDCYGCYGPAENPNTAALSNRWSGLGLLPNEIANRYLHINNNAPTFQDAARAAKKSP